MTDKLANLSREILVDVKYAAATGYFLIAFSYLEEELNRTLWTILGHSKDSRGTVVTTAVRDFGQRMLLLAKLCKAYLTHDKPRENGTKVIRAIQFVNDRRVELVHGELAAWDTIQDTAIFIQTRADRTQVTRTPALFSTDYLCELTTYTLKTAEALNVFRRNLLDGTDHALPSLDTRPTQPV